jgi:hypothetical protein
MQENHQNAKFEKQHLFLKELVVMYQSRYGKLVAVTKPISIDEFTL